MEKTITKARARIKLPDNRRNNRFLVAWFLPALLLILAVVPGCSGSGKPYSNEGYGITFQVPDGWEMVEEKEQRGLLTISYKNLNRDSSLLTVTVFPFDFMQVKDAPEETEKLLRTSLFAVEEPLQREEITLPGKKSLTLVTAQAGEKEKVGAVGTIYSGGEHHALITLIARQENFDLHTAEFRSFIESVKLD